MAVTNMQFPGVAPAYVCLDFDRVRTTGEVEIRKLIEATTVAVESRRSTADA
jgi:hypothetical protein